VPAGQARVTSISKNEGLVGKEITSWTGYEKNANLKGQQGIQTYQRILNNNSTAWALYYVQYVMLQQVKFEIRPGKNKKSTQILEASLANIKQKWLMHKASLALPFGYSLIEVGLEVNSKGHIIISKLGFRPQASIESWGYDDSSESYVSAIQNTGMGKYAEIPLKKCLHFRLSPDFDASPEGRSQLRTGVRPYQYIETIQETEGIGIDRDLTGIPLLEVPMEITLPTASEEEQARYAEAKRLVSSIRQGQFAGLVLPSEMSHDNTPSGWKFKVITSGGSKLINTNEIVKRYEVEILMLGLFEVLILGMQGKPGSNALASEQTTFGAMAIGSAIEYITEEMNNFADTLFELNGLNAPREDLARFAPSDIESLDFSKIGDFISKLPALFPDSPELAEFCHKLIGAPFNEKEWMAWYEEKKAKSATTKQAINGDNAQGASGPETQKTGDSQTQGPSATENGSSGDGSNSDSATED
jgi:hypothetical protein